MASIGSAGTSSAGQIPVEAARQAAVLAKQKEVMAEQGEQVVKLIESASVQLPRSTGVGQILDIRV
ncbi:MAG TPA: hypothetical protein PK166_04040 [Candidatus Hydrogenedentes bacterium]|nr:hypothetical protein [Candidatus Hydrogenedentota bacterium]HQH67541.1 hypothetical protein [Candidatus Hydrogenedentota bacterium]HQM49699.1 hypothetical protein [Candidatus Hydrogenedentota bacterium]